MHGAVTGNAFRGCGYECRGVSGNVAGVGGVCGVGPRVRGQTGRARERGVACVAPGVASGPCVSTGPDGADVWRAVGAGPWNGPGKTPRRTRVVRKHFSLDNARAHDPR